MSDNLSFIVGGLMFATGAMGFIGGFITGIGFREREQGTAQKRHDDLEKSYIAALTEGEGR